MLQELSIRNFAIIESLNLSIEEGLTVLSGETGAGKSIIIDAIHLLVGGRGSAEFVRHGEKKAEIEGLFYLDRQDHPCYQKAEVVGVEIEDDMLILRREISASGKSVCRINGKLVTISTLREIGSTLVDIHGQHEHQELMDERFHLLLLDQFGGNEIISALSNYQEIYTVYDQSKKHLDKLNDNEQKTAHRLDLIQFQLSEIEKAELRLHEDEELMEEKRKLNNFEKLYEALNSAYESIQGEQKALDWTGLAMSHMESVSDIDEELNTVLDSVSSSYYALEDASRTIRYQLDGLEYNPERLHEIEDRLNEINSLKRKYGNSIEEILEYSARIEEEIDQITNRDTHILELQNKLASFEKDLEIEANNLTDVRKKVATELTNSIHDQLQELYMAKTVFQVRFDQIQRSFGKNGQDVIEFYISTNPGEPLKPLSKVASGGELSRIMLALKTIFSKHQGITSIIFDEVDTGVSGRVAQAIAEKIYTVATNSQVLCISHLPQVAAMADTHLYISKITKNERTSTKVNVLTKDEKITEIGRMISGVEITELTKDHAKELLEIANKMKKAYT